MMQRRGRTLSSLSAKAAVWCFLLAIAVRVLTLGEGAGRFSEAMNRVAARPGFVELALKSEMRKTLINGGNVSHWAGVLRSDCAAFSCFSPKEEEEPEADESKTPGEAVLWSFSPGSVAAEEKDERLPIKAITIRPTSEKGYDVYDKIYVKNDTSQKVDIGAMLKAGLPFKFKGSGPHVLLVHTHGSEAYFPDGKDSYTPTDVERTEDKSFNVIRVGDELSKVLEDNGFAVLHDRNIYDSPTYNGSYTRTLAAITEQMRKTPSIKVIIDIHRDAMTTNEGVKYKTVADIDGVHAAQIMIIMSTGESGLKHPNWKENLHFAFALQNKVEKKYPGLMRPINLRPERFNMHVTTGSMLIEVGTSANTLQEALTAIRLLGGELSELLKTAK